MDKRGAYFDRKGGELNLYVRTDEGAELKLSPDQEAFMRMAFVLNGTRLAPGEGVGFTSDGDTLAEHLSWSTERMKQVAKELELLGVLEAKEE